VVAKQVAREGISGEMRVCLNLNEVGNILELITLNFIASEGIYLVDFPNINW
jgi:hypothetical protein